MKVCLALGSFALGSVAALAASTANSKPTFSKEVAPVIFKRCVECHRAGEAAPMAFTSYKEVRPWAKAIKAAVVGRTMPVWLADPSHGSFRNERRLTDTEIQTISAWVDNGSPEGDPRDLPALPKFETGWQIGKPDAVFDMGTDFNIPAEGVVPYQYFTVPTNFKEDMWVEAAEIRPGTRSAIHHVIVFLQEPGTAQGRGGGGDGMNMLTGFAPGEQPLHLEPGTAKLVKAGTTLRFQVHYTPNGTAYKDRSSVGMRFSKVPVKYQALVASAIQFNFKIPAGDGNYEVKSTWTAREDVQLVALMPHMHVRGKDFKYTVTYPDGRQEVLLNVPRYDFNWQLSYETSQYLSFPKGTRIDCVAHFDNSTNNKYNPDPTKDVKWGDQTWEEMMIGFLTYVRPVAPAESSKAEE